MSRPPVRFAVHIDEESTGLVFEIACEKCGLTVAEVNGNDNYELTKIGHWLADHFYNCKGGTPPVVAIP